MSSCCFDVKLIWWEMLDEDWSCFVQYSVLTFIIFGHELNLKYVERTFAVIYDQIMSARCLASYLYQIVDLGADWSAARIYLFVEEFWEAVIKLCLAEAICIIFWFSSWLNVINILMFFLGPSSKFIFYVFLWIYCYFRLAGLRKNSETIEFNQCNYASMPWVAVGAYQGLTEQLQSIHGIIDKGLTWVTRDWV
jgi:hypothetical protein